MMQNWVNWLVHQRVMLPSIRSPTAWRNGLAGVSRSSTRRSAKSCIWRGKTPDTTSICWGLSSWKAAWQRGLWLSWWPWANSVPLQQRSLVVLWGCIRVLPSGEGRWSFPITQAWWGHTWSTVSRSGLSKRAVAIAESVHQRGQRWLVTRACLPWWKAWESWDCSACQRGGSGVVSTRYIKLPGGVVYSRRRQALSSGSQWQDQRQRSHTETREVPSEHQETLFHCEGDQVLAQVKPKSLSLEILRSHLDVVLGRLLLMALLE